MSTHEPVVTQQILDLISSKSDEQRTSRRMSKDVVDALKECGFFTMLLPKQWGGLERKPQEFFAEQVRIAEADTPLPGLLRGEAEPRSTLVQRPVWRASQDDHVSR